MNRILAVFLAITAFLAVCLYWGWQIATGQPAINIESILLRAVLAMVVVFVIGWFLSRVGVAVVSETWQETQARRRDREMARSMGIKESESSTDETPEGAESTERA